MNRQKVHESYKNTAPTYREYFDMKIRGIDSPKINDTTRLAPLARDDLVRDIPGVEANPAFPPINAFVALCAEYDALVK